MRLWPGLKMEFLGAQRPPPCPYMAFSFSFGSKVLVTVSKTFRLVRYGCNHLQYFYCFETCFILFFNSDNRCLFSREYNETDKQGEFVNISLL